MKTEQYHYQRLLEVKQGKDDDDDDVLSFSDRVKFRAQKHCPVREILQYKIRTNLNARRSSCLRLYMALGQAYRLQCKLQAPKPGESHRNCKYSVLNFQI